MRRVHQQEEEAEVNKTHNPNRGEFALLMTALKPSSSGKSATLLGTVQVQGWDKDRGNYDMAVEVRLKCFAPWVTRLVNCEGKRFTVHYENTGNEFNGKRYLNYNVVDIEGLSAPQAPPTPKQEDSEELPF